jgi:hypothetical protein
VAIIVLSVLAAVAIGGRSLLRRHFKDPEYTFSDFCLFLINTEDKAGKVGVFPDPEAGIVNFYAVTGSGGVAAGNAVPTAVVWPDAFGGEGPVKADTARKASMASAAGDKYAKSCDANALVTAAAGDGRSVSDDDESKAGERDGDVWSLTSGSSDELSPRLAAAKTSYEHEAMVLEAAEEGVAGEVLSTWLSSSDSEGHDVNPVAITESVDLSIRQAATRAVMNEPSSDEDAPDVEISDTINEEGLSGEVEWFSSSDSDGAEISPDVGASFEGAGGSRNNMLIAVVGSVAFHSDSVEGLSGEVEWFSSSDSDGDVRAEMPPDVGASVEGAGGSGNTMLIAAVSAVAFHSDSVEGLSGEVEWFSSSDSDGDVRAEMPPDWLSISSDGEE